ncbi:hypothetical protein I2I05_08375 [Hymenobacter sp. BT683]|uniref:DUF7033 domain-containing protein n=1 Tax=Hymenobacter jeongseonensis TaxID=2791027 RepID=A0ABS0IGC7_9BACT|nr:hypothetical protein [Hymenobacter jeongseonensis]MBF9237411.1 hypothetical protein [Hymenobacter jeongseonensis]
MPTDAHSAVLPPLAAVPVSQEMRLAYVLRHFWLAYEAVPHVAIGYAAAQPAMAPAITIAEGTADFFQQQTPYPPAPAFREWAGQQVPFFFDSQPGAALLEKGIAQATIGVDIISAAFYLLSGWQEYFSDVRDQHGRFPYAASVHKQYGFVALPVVNYYFDVLKTAVEHVTGQVLRPRSWQTGAPFAAFITHDVDTLRSAWKAPAKAALQRGQYVEFGLQMWRHLTQPDAWDNLTDVATATAAYGARSTFFILPSHRISPQGVHNADYKLTPQLKNDLQDLAAQGCELALHGSIGTATDIGQLRADWANLGERSIAGNRFHYLSWEPRLTPEVVEAAMIFGIGYDTTLGFAEHFGFRHSYCHPFYPFNFETGDAHRFLEIPLNVMDATLHHPHYLQLQPDEILPALRPMFAEVVKFGGVATLLWHNDHFDPANAVTGPRQFADLMDYLQHQKVAFLTGREIWQQMAGS